MIIHRLLGNTFQTKMEIENELMALATVGAGADAGALRKNKAFQQLKREMEMKMRQKRKEEVLFEERRAEVSYIDRDRAAAVVIGNKDIKNELKVKKKRDRMENARDPAAVLEEVDYETYLLQGEHELKAGDPKRALIYLTNACETCPDKVDGPFILRSQCHAKLGLYQHADRGLYRQRR